jgi:HEAT repeat protein
MLWVDLAMIGAAIGILVAAKGHEKLQEFLSVRRDSGRRLRVWHRAATSCGLQVEEVSFSSARRLKLTARAGPVAVRIAGARGLDEDIEVVVAVPGPPGFSEVSIHRAPRNPVPWVQGIEVGDKPFDKTFYLGGPMRLVCALLDAETRGRLRSVSSECSLELFGGELQAETSDWKLSYVLPRLLDLGRRLSEPRDLAIRLASNAGLDPVAGVRLQSLRCLALESPGDSRTVETLRKACSDTIPKIRLWAARELGPEGRDVLRQLAESEVDDDCSAQAISALGPELPYETTRAILVRALRGRRIQKARACLEVLSRSGTAAAIEDLAKVMALEKGELAVAAVRALEATGNPAAEPPLIQALKHERWEVQMAAANGLGRLGSTAAVLPLEEAAKRFSLDPDLARAARQAIAEIQARLPDASPGQLSLAGAETGQLSLATESGELSLAPADPAGQLSLPPEEPES